MTKKLILCLSNSIIPSDGSVTSIGKNAFVSCYSLENVTIPASITTIDNYAFFFCSGLTTIEFKGTIAQWNAIKKGSNWNYDVPTTCKVKCTDGTISI